MRKTTKLTIIVGITLLIFYLIFRKVDYVTLKGVFSKANWIYLGAALLVTFLVPVLSAKKWQKVLQAMSCQISWLESLKIIFASFPVSTITPAKSGDLIRAHYLKDKIPPLQTMGAVVMERLLDISVLAFYSLLGALILQKGFIAGVALGVLCLTVLCCLIVSKIKLRSQKWQGRIDGFVHTLKIFVQEPRKILPVLLYAFLFWLIPIFQVKLLFLALGSSISLLYVAAAFPLAIFIGLVPITIAGMGTRDSAIIYFFSSGAGASVCLGMGLLYSLLSYWLLALIGLPFTKKMLWAK